jgi:Ca2+-binding EF-hand superfamily protein
MMEKLSIKISPENLAYIFQKIDFDKSGSIDLHEFLRFIKENQQTSEKRV